MIHILRLRLQQDFERIKREQCDSNVIIVIVIARSHSVIFFFRSQTAIDSYRSTKYENGASERARTPSRSFCIIHTGHPIAVFKGAVGFLVTRAYYVFDSGLVYTDRLTGVSNSKFKPMIKLTKPCDTRYDFSYWIAYDLVDC